MNNKDDILESDDISELAPLFRNMVKDPYVTNCHEFIENIFRVPGTLKRETIDSLRTQLAANAADKR